MFREFIEQSRLKMNLGIRVYNEYLFIGSTEVTNFNEHGFKVIINKEPIPILWARYDQIIRSLED